MSTRLAALAALVLVLAPARAGAGPASRLIVFRAPGFPTVDAPVVPAGVLDQALAGLPADTAASVADLRTRLAPGSRDVLVLPYGSAFPLEAWIAIRDFVGKGGGLVVLGGAPFHQPVRATAAGDWALGPRQPTFAHVFLIGPAEPVDASGLKTVLPDASWTAPVEGARTAWELTVRLGRRPMFPGEGGSESEREAVLRPLVHLVDAGGLPRACPLLEIDRLRGDEAGARWIFAPSDAPLSAAAIHALLARALEGAAALEARPVAASVPAGETPRVAITLRRPGLAAGTAPAATRAQWVVRGDGGTEAGRGEVSLTGTADLRTATAEIRTPGALRAGLHHVEVTIEGLSGPARSVTTGFWVRDAALLSSAPRLTVSRDWLRKDGAVFPVLGTTYMSSAVHRQFLFEPDPEVWDRDFAQMQRLGVGFVRTGLWTGWSRALDEAGHPREEILSALEAYVQAAARHGIEVAFTFYAFLPLAHGGTNPYLDPRSLDGQKAFLSAVARRFRGVGWIHYDLINEPSYAPPEGLWSNRPIGDAYEKATWRDWVKTRHGDDVAALREGWAEAGDDPLVLPRTDELGYAAIREDKHPRKAHDFVLFSQEVAAGWARRSRDVLREAGGDVLVTLGQDEGGTWLRPSQQLHADAVDYTSIHPWWLSDDVLSTGVLAKVPEKPSLFQETGLMRLEDADGRPWRSPEIAAQVLERKFAYAFAARNAGAVEWAWNINPYMPIDNESVIGFFRPDGTAKPELRALTDLVPFVRAAAPWLDDFAPDPVVIVIPHSRLFMGRPAATDGFRRAVRVLAERLGVVPTALSELRLSAERLRDARLVFVPSPEVLDDGAAQALLAASKAGTRVLVTGSVTGDPYGRITPALDALRVADAGRPVRYAEATSWGRGGWATFDRNLQEGLRASTAPPLAAFAGNIWHEPLPLEHAREEEPLAALLAKALAEAGVETHAADGGVALRVLDAPRAALVLAVNETSADARRTLNLDGHTLEVTVPAGRTRLVLIERATGRLIVQAP